MVISDGMRCIFVHIQKTGGSSIEDLLRANDPGIGSSLYEGRRHMFARDIRPLVEPAKWARYFKFAFVRNPWDRLVSWYSMIAQARETNRFGMYVREVAPSFDAFVNHATTGMGERTTWNQLDYVSDAGAAMLVDFVGRYETLQADIAYLKQRLGLGHDLPHTNRSTHDAYRQYYTSETRDIVARRFARDIEHFGYRF
jgi:chondroitin 4-sulfotransferase 11